MSLILDPTWQAFDSNGNVIVGATLTVYNAGGTTPAAIFRDAALTVPMTNPTTGTDRSNASGRFPRFYAAEGALFDLILKDQLGNTIDNPLSVPSLGTATGALVRDFTTSRFQARGSGGTTYIEAGDPTGDDVGGTMQLGGWNGTQADLITLAAALVNITGKLKENSKKLPSVVATEATQVTAAASVDITLPNDPTGVRAWELEIFDYSQSGNANLSLRMAYDAAPSTFASGGSDYVGAGLWWDSNSGVLSPASLGGASLQLCGNLNGATNKPARGVIRFTTPASGSDCVKVSGDLEGIENHGYYATFRIHGYGPASSGHLAAIRLLIGAGTMTFKYAIRPLRGLGEV